SFDVDVAAPVLDFGDAPASYGTRLADDGARHLAVGPFLGLARDAERDATGPLDGRGDNVTGQDDEDGVVLGPLTPGGTGVARVSTRFATGGVLNAWIDFDRSGTFEPSERITSGDGLRINSPDTQ